MDYNYSELCEFFNEPKEKSNKKTLQFERWRKEYNITKLPNKNRYTLEKKPLDTKELSTKRVDLKRFIEPMICELFIQENTRHLGTTQKELHEKLGLVNDNFFKIGYMSELKESYALKLKVSTDELVSYKNEVYDLNKVTINRVLDDMVKKGILIVDRTYKIKHIDNSITYADDNLKTSIMEKRNEIARAMSDGMLYNQIKDKHLKEKVIKAVNSYFGIVGHYDAMMLHLDIESVKIYLSNEYAHYNTYAETMLDVNKANRDKIVKSKRGELKNIPYDDKKKITTEIVAIE